MALQYGQEMRRKHKLSREGHGKALDLMRVILGTYVVLLECQTTLKDE